MLHRKILESPANKNLVANEINILKDLNHNHIIGFECAFSDNDYIYIMTELCDLGPLSQIIAARKLEIDECRYVLYHIFNGMKYLHKTGFIHRDLKPSNIVIDSNMQMKICDFGLAIHERNAHLEAQIMCGTPNYLAPEVIELKGAKFQSDVWAAGITAFFLLYKYKPFDSNQQREMFRRICLAKYR